MRAQIVGQCLQVVLPDRRPIQHGGGEDHVIARPKPARRTAARSGSGAWATIPRRSCTAPPLKIPSDRYITFVDQACTAGRKLDAERALDEALADQRGGGRLLSARHPRRRLPSQALLLPPVRHRALTKFCASAAWPDLDVGCSRREHIDCSRPTHSIGQREEAGCPRTMLVELSRA